MCSRAAITAGHWLVVYEEYVKRYFYYIHSESYKNIANCILSEFMYEESLHSQPTQKFF